MRRRAGAGGRARAQAGGCVQVRARAGACAGGFREAFAKTLGRPGPYDKIKQNRTKYLIERLAWI